MIDRHSPRWMRGIYQLSAGLGMLGTILYWSIADGLHACSFAAGVMGALGNLWIWNLLGKIISRESKPQTWQAGLFIGRYLILGALGFAIVRHLGFDALAFLLGLETSAGAVLIALILEILAGFLRREPAIER